MTLQLKNKFIILDKKNIVHSISDLESSVHKRSGTNEILVTTPDYDSLNERLDKFVASKLSGEISRSKIQEAIEKGDITVNDSPKKASYKLILNDVVTIDIPAASENAQSITPYEMQIDVLFEDEHIIVINKSNNIIVHPALSVSEPTLLDGLAFKWGRMPEIGSAERPCVVHRLDRNTSGVLVLAKTQKAYLKLVSDFKESVLEKKYLALVTGNFNTANGRFDTFYGRHQNNRLKMTSKVSEGKRAITKWKLLQNFSGSALVEVHLITGRTHQIRVHFSENGHAVIGDNLYGDKAKHIAKLPQEIQNIAKELPGQALHSYSLKLKHPITNVEMKFIAPLPECFSKILQEYKYEL